MDLKYQYTYSSKKQKRKKTRTSAKCRVVVIKHQYTELVYCKTGHTPRILQTRTLLPLLIGFRFCVCVCVFVFLFFIFYKSLKYLKNILKFFKKCPDEPDIFLKEAKPTFSAFSCAKYRVTVVRD